MKGSKRSFSSSTRCRSPNSNRKNIESFHGPNINQRSNQHCPSPSNNTRAFSEPSGNFLRLDEVHKDYRNDTNSINYNEGAANWSIWDIFSLESENRRIVDKIDQQDGPEYLTSGWRPNFLLIGFNLGVIVSTFILPWILFGIVSSSAKQYLYYTGDGNQNQNQNYGQYGYGNTFKWYWPWGSSNSRNNNYRYDDNYAYQQGNYNENYNENYNGNYNGNGQDQEQGYQAYRWGSWFWGSNREEEGEREDQQIQGKPTAAFIFFWGLILFLFLVVYANACLRRYKSRKRTVDPALIQKFQDLGQAKQDKSDELEKNIEDIRDQMQQAFGGAEEKSKGVLIGVLFGFANMFFLLSILMIKFLVNTERREGPAQDFTDNVMVIPFTFLFW
eukprot:CAMPEP_0194329440 /NCGR_PEP_ID=MMETSP0171-20130528/48284_1 /TAXON_ID=218684 /ORGANISM="Corethron pennatum, Strain L29A3" /LENGTH=386 /DNA_ID=CAMNT_0039090179 /DNA_START=70 /DNA_END=1227 /DNA_ORIENTATION=+